VQKNLNAIGLRVSFQVAQWPENLKAARAGSLTAWSLGSTAAAPGLARRAGALRQPPDRRQNLARFQLKEFDACTNGCSRCPTGPSARRCSISANRLAVAYMPVQVSVSAGSSPTCLPVADRLPARAVLAGVVALRRHRPRCRSSRLRRASPR
jgi:hypothetical protein